MNYDILIQVINYNTKKYLETCLNSLLNDIENSGINYEIIVLDNNSDDDLEELLRLYEHTKIYFHHSNENLGFGGGHNFISTLKESKYTLILNPDIELIEKDTVKRLLERLIISNKFKVIGPKLLEENFLQQPFDHGELQGIFSWMKNNYGSSFWKPRNDPVEVAWVSGAVFMIETKLFKDIGRFDNNFFLYKEEEDLCKRIRNKNEKILYDPTVSVMHYGHVVAKRSEHFSNSMNYYIDKHYRNNISYKILNMFKVVKDLTLYGKIKERE